MQRAQATIHPTAVVEDGATLGDRVEIGPFCHIGAEAVLGSATRLLSHVVVSGPTTIGANCIVHPFATLGGPPQSTGHKGGRTTLSVGDNCTIREYVTMNRGTDFGRGATTVGNNCNFLAYSHVAHDCAVGNNVTLTNGATLAGHVEVGDYVGMGGLCAVHQFVRVGHNAFIAGGAMVEADIIPYGMAAGNRAKLHGLNIVGLRRSGMAPGRIRELRLAYKFIFDPAHPLSENLEKARSKYAGFSEAMKIIDFLTVRGKRHMTVPPLKRSADEAFPEQE